MVITELYIRNFGKLSDRHFYLGSGIQIISGDNEFGKTTLHAFVRAMLFGLERSRGRAAANDAFSRYEPWGDPGNFGGIMWFVCGDRRFRLERDFARYTKRAVLICEDDGEELSVEDGDLKMLLGGLTESVFDNTVSVGQLKAEPGRGLSEALADYTANYYETGGGGYNLSGALQILNEKRRETERELRAAEEAENKERMEVQRELQYLENDIQHLEAEYGERKEQLDKTAQMSGGRAGKIAEDERTSEETGNKAQVKRHAAGTAACAVSAAGAAAVFFGVLDLFSSPAVQKVQQAAVFIGIVLLAAGGMVLLCRIRSAVRGRKAEERYRSQEEQRRRTRGYDAAEEQRHRLNGELLHICRERREKELRYENLREQLEEYRKSEQQLRLEQRCRALDLAAERLQQAAKVTGGGTERRIGSRMSEIFARITQGQYRSVEAGRTKSGFRITVWDGERRIPAGKLSRGTIEQLYFSLRMAAADVLLEEPFPVILDDVFVFYDDKRLESVLQWLSREKEQVILLTCHHREERILNNSV